MDHLEADRVEAAERYFLGELGPEERDAFEAHYFDCPVCASDVRSLSTFLDGARESLAKEKPAATPRLRRTSVSVIPWALAASLLAAVGLITYQTGVVVPRLERQIEAYGSIRPAQSFFLSVSRAEPQVVTVRPGDRDVVVALSRSSAQSFASYECSLLDAAGAEVTRARLDAPPVDELQVLLPVSRLRAGAYVLKVAGLESGGLAAPIEVARYHFVVRFEEGVRR